jgi:ParB family chromosome partitioning protein
MGKRDRLGRGLGALLGEYLDAPSPEDVVTRRLRVAAVVPNPFQPRREFDEAELAELVDSIRSNGLLQPIVVRPASGSSDLWELVAGERRWRAVTRLGWTEVPAVVREVDDTTLLVLALVENLQRAGLSPLEEAEGYQRLARDFSLTASQIAEAVGRDRSTIANTLRLLQLPPSVRQLLSTGKLTAGHARALLGLPSERRMSELGREAVEQGWSVRQLEARVQGARGNSRASAGDEAGGARQRARAPEERRLEQELQRALGTSVKLRRGRDSRGRVEIFFYGDEDFERLFELLVGRPAGDLVW